MLRKTFFFSICTVVPFLVVEWYARQHFVEYADDEAYLKLAFNRLLNSLVIPATEQPNSPLFGYALTPNVHRTVETDDFTYEIQTNSVGFRTREIAPNSVYLKGIPVDASDDDITSALAGFGAVSSVSHREGRDFAFAVLDSADALAAAIAGSVTVGGQSVVVEERTGGKPGAASQ